MITKNRQNLSLQSENKSCIQRRHIYVKKLFIYLSILQNVVTPDLPINSDKTKIKNNNIYNIHRTIFFNKFVIFYTVNSYKYKLIKKKPRK